MDFEFNDPVNSLVTNVKKAEHLSIKIKELLIKCVFSRVKWRDTVYFFSNNKILEAVECSPGKALTNMFKRSEFEINVQNSIIWRY